MLAPWPLSASPSWERSIRPCWEMGAFLYGFPTCVWRTFSDRLAANCQEDPRASVTSASRQEAWGGEGATEGCEHQAHGEALLGYAWTCICTCASARCTHM